MAKKRGKKKWWKRPGVQMTFVTLGVVGGVLFWHFFGPKSKQAYYLY
jgi:hypothetical protein